MTTIQMDPAQARSRYFQRGNQSPEYRTTLDNLDFVDGRGVHYTFDQHGTPIYTSPVSYGGSLPQHDGNFFKQDSSWDTQTGEPKRDWNWQNIGSLAVGGIAGAAAAPAIAGALSGGGAAGTGGAAAAGTGGAPAGVLPSTLLGSSAAGAVPGGLVAGGSGLGAAGTAGAGAAAAGAGATGAGAAGTTLSSLLTPRTLAQLAPLILAAAHRPGGQDAGPDIQNMMAEYMRRMTAQRPVFDAVNSQILNNMPRQTRGVR